MVFLMSPSCHISQRQSTVAEILRANGLQFQMAAVCHLGFQNFNCQSGSEGQYVSISQILCWLVEPWPRHGHFSHFSRWRPSTILDLFYVYLDHPQRLFVGLCHCARFGWNRCSHFNNMWVLMFCKFGLKMPIHVPFWWFLEDLTP